MSFPTNADKKISITNLLSKRERRDSSLTHHIFKNSSHRWERASSFTSKGSMTVEAAFSVSIFFLAVISLTNLLEMMSIQTEMKNALHMVAKEYAAEAYLHPLISTEKIEEEIVEHIGKERLDKSLIMYGCEGLDASETKREWNTTIVEFVLKYRIEIPIAMFRIRAPWQMQKIRVKGWTGYEFSLPNIDGDQMVYVTDYGMVYHRNKNCTYLDLSVKSVDRNVVSDLRSQNGGKYKACILCGTWEKQDLVYITDYGERYHTSLECSGLKRNVYAIPLSDVRGLGGCSKCVN